MVSFFLEIQEAVKKDENYLPDLRRQVAEIKEVNYEKLLNDILPMYKKMEGNGDGEKFLSLFYATIVRYGSNYVEDAPISVSRLLMKKL